MVVQEEVAVSACIQNGRTGCLWLGALPKLFAAVPMFFGTKHFFIFDSELVSFFMYFEVKTRRVNAKKAIHGAHSLGFARRVCFAEDSQRCLSVRIVNILHIK